jgi:anti-anti-sigma regulatory factor
MVVLGGEIDVAGAARLSAKLATLQRDQSVVVDLWDVTLLDAEGVEALMEARQRAHDAGWGFAVVADPHGAAADAIRAAGNPEGLYPYPTRYAARTALQVP